MPGASRDSASRPSFVALSSSKIRFERFGIVGEAREHRGSAVGELRGNQAMRISLIDGSGSEHSAVQSLCPVRISVAAATRVEQTTHANHPRHPPRTSKSSGGAPLNMGLEFGREVH